MSNRTKQREIVSKLPKNAVSVSEFAKNYVKENGEVGCSQSYVYKLHNLDKIRIVQFGTFNFVLTKV